MKTPKNGHEGEKRGSMKRIFAIIGAGLLVMMYLMTLIFALSGSENYWGMLMASIAATITIPVLLYAYSLIYKTLKDRAQTGLMPENTEKKSPDMDNFPVTDGDEKEKDK